MKVLYDYQAFVWSKYAGIPRYFSELISEFSHCEDITISIPDFYTPSEDYRSLEIRKNIVGDSLRDIIIRDGIVDTSLKLFNKNPTKLLCTPSAMKKSVALVKKGDYDIFHPTHHDPYFLKYIDKKPYVMTIHDLSVEIFPEYVPLDTSLRNNTEILASSAVRFIADSHSTKQDFIEYYDVEPDLVDVVHLAPTFDQKWVNEVLKKSVSVHTRPYLLFVNMRSGRKNFYTLVNVIAKILIERDLDLICVGGGPFDHREIRFLELLNLNSRVKQCTVSNEELYVLYRDALMFLYPSVNEGFGIPILEAYACGCPVVLSNASCLPEVGGDAAKYFEPKSIRSIREAVYSVLDDEKLRINMREKGYKQLSKFSWEKCARETYIVYQKIME